jgi:hypothetical protein
MWLNLLVDDQQWGNVTKLKQKFELVQFPSLFVGVRNHLFSKRDIDNKVLSKCI